MVLFGFLQFQKTLQYWVFLILTFIFLSVLCHVHCLNDDEVLKRTFRPLKYSIDCKEFCKNIICQPIKECSDGVILKNESYCNCCEACVKFLDIGQACTDTIKGSIALGSQRRCKKGCICKNGKCELDPDVNSCLLHRDIRKKLKETGKYANDIWIPQCDEEGNYEAKQKKTMKSVCFDKYGNKIFGNADNSVKNFCACSRFTQEAMQKDPILFNIKAKEHCSLSGSFDTMQCINNLCYCSDENTGEVKSDLVRMDFLQVLPCYDSKKHTEKYLKDCETELQRSKGLALQFKKKGVAVIGIDKVKCDPDGTFSPTQCLPDRCVCTNKEGVGIRQYYESLQNIFNKNMTCNCARDEYSSPFMPFSCEIWGSYKSFTCFGGKCICVDEDGEGISKEVDESETNSCPKMIEDLNKNTIEDEDTSSSDSDYDNYDYK